ncbi:hypothetical protein HPTD01_3 [Halomonas sp. TD01]|nr:hypothetical protein HPTD01_3 [Halomonas sp. TD01]
MAGPSPRRLPKQTLNLRIAHGMGRAYALPINANPLGLVLALRSHAR